MQQLADELNGPVKSAIKASAYVVSNQIIFASFTGQVRTGACGDEQQSINEVSCHFSSELRPGSFRRILSLAGYGCDQGDVTCNISYHNRASALLALIPSFTGDWAIDLSVCFCWCRCTLLEENAKFKGTHTLGASPYKIGCQGAEIQFGFRVPMLPYEKSHILKCRNFLTKNNMYIFIIYVRSSNFTKNQYFL
jgi:hypothetical protein